MIKETKVASYRLDTSSVEWIRTKADLSKITQAELIRNLIQQSESITLAKDGIDTSISLSKSTEQNNLLLSLGVGTASGLTGYYIAGWIRKQFDMEEDKGSQIVTGLIVGLSTLFLTAAYNQKK
jgi:hypothetical protein